MRMWISMVIMNWNSVLDASLCLVPRSVWRQASERTGSLGMDPTYDGAL
jgi:hypothetical protein